MMTINKLKENLDYYIPNPKCELNYCKDYELVISVMLSAQCTDKRVNEVTKYLYKYELIEIANLSIKEIENIIMPLGSYHRKALYIHQIANILIAKYNSIVPNDRKSLESMPGIGRKCSNVILSELFNEPTFAVDTHVERVTKRLGLVNETDTPLIIEKKLSKLFNKNDYNKINHQILLFGRYYCKTKNPLCRNCKMDCKYKK
ncbi:MAG: endonuclease III domain-containing protein [Bacilli bacterium]